MYKFFENDLNYHSKKNTYNSYTLKYQIYLNSEINLDLAKICLKLRRSIYKFQNFNIRFLNFK